MNYHQYFKPPLTPDQRDFKSRSVATVNPFSPISTLRAPVAWLGRNRRLSKDYEQLPEVSEAMVYAAMVRLMLQRLVSASGMT